MKIATVEIREINDNDLFQISRIHMAAFPDSALTKLGIEAVRRYYHWQLHGPHDCYAIAADDAGQMLGFCFGGVFRGALGGFLQKNKQFLFWRVLLRPWLLFNEIFRDRLSIALRSLKIISPKKEKVKPPSSPAKIKSFSILSIAVDPFIQAKGVGKKLMVAAEQESAKKNYSQMNLTVSPKNLQAINFYTGLGWVKKGDPWAGSMIKKLK